MSRGQNTIKRSEVSTTPILLKYSASYASSSFLANGITVNRGINSSFSTDGVQFLNYALVKQLYYQEYLTGSLLGSSSFWNPSNQSTAASGTLDNDYRYFPTSSNAQLTVIGIPRTAFGEQIARTSFIITGSTYRLIDDGNGNVIDSNNSNYHVGNILYSQGVVIITDSEYQNALIPIPGATTTTTTTAAPTTTTTTAAPTTTTTTAGPTTTTTTAAPTTTTTTAAPTTTTTTAGPTTTTTTAAPTTTTTTAPPTTTTTSTTTTTTTVAPNVFFQYENGVIGTGIQTWQVEFSTGSLFTNAVTLTANNNVALGTPTIVSASSTGPLGITATTNVNVRVRKTSNSGLMGDSTAFSLLVDPGTGYSIVGSFSVTTAENPIGPTTWREITVDTNGLGNHSINPGDKIQLQILEG